MSNQAEHDGPLIEAMLEAELGVPARVLDLFAAQNWLPQAFAFRREAEGLRLHIVAGPMAASRRGILLAKLRCVEGVHAVRELACTRSQ